MNYIIDELLQYDLTQIKNESQIERNAQYIWFCKNDPICIRCYKYVNVTFSFDSHYYYKCANYDMIEILIDILVNFSKNYTNNYFKIMDIDNKFLFIEKYTNNDASLFICDDTKFVCSDIDLIHMSDIAILKKKISYKYYFILIWKIDNTNTFYAIE